MAKKSEPAAISELDKRIDFYPTHRQGEYRFRQGKPFPFGASLVPGGVNFSIYSRHTTACTLVLFEKGADKALVEIPFPDSFRIGHVWSMLVFGLDCETTEYGYRMDGPNDPKAGHRFDKTKVLMDPYAKAVGGRDTWGAPPNWQRPCVYRGRLVFEDFDWEDDRPLEIPMKELIVYEMHLRGFTRHSSSGVKHPGTMAAMMEKIPYLKELGVNCVELLPINEFDEYDNARKNPLTGQMLYNYWGYSTVGFFAPKAGYAATGRFGMQVDEFKNLVKQLHKNGIEVLLDVVFNHTAEGNEKGPSLSFRGIDNQTYYMLTNDGAYFNFSGCGNTLNCNNPIVRNMVLDCLRYWASEFHIDGFRFDAAAILGRDPWGAPLSNPPLLETLAFDPVLGKCKLIAEAWDAGGLYQVGTFPAYGRWAEWNGKYRDEMRRFIKGDPGQVRNVSLRIQGSPDLYGANRRGPMASINFITCHDGFTLYDMLAYNAKHNEANGENNRDGIDENCSWNCGVEGETNDGGVQRLRRQMMKNAWTLLMVSHGVPMVLMGDEFGRTQRGNNNSYCQDNELSWMDWSLTQQNAELLRFARLAIALRKAHPVLRSETHLRNQDYVKSGYADITWHGTRAWNPDWSENSRTLAYMLCGKHAQGVVKDNYLYVAMNSFWEPLSFELPQPGGLKWHVAINTGAPSPQDAFEPGQEPALSDQRAFLLPPRSVIVLVGK
jgi:glycogen operon protein